MSVRDDYSYQAKQHAYDSHHEPYHFPTLPNILRMLFGEYATEEILRLAEEQPAILVITLVCLLILPMLLTFVCGAPYREPTDMMLHLRMARKEFANRVRKLKEEISRDTKLLEQAHSHSYENLSFVEEKIRKIIGLRAKATRLQSVCDRLKEVSDNLRGVIEMPRALDKCIAALSQACHERNSDEVERLLLRYHTDHQKLCVPPYQHNTEDDDNLYRYMLSRWLDDQRLEDEITNLTINQPATKKVTEAELQERLNRLRGK